MVHGLPEVVGRPAPDPKVLVWRDVAGENGAERCFDVPTAGKWLAATGGVAQRTVANAGQVAATGYLCIIWGAVGFGRRVFSALDIGRTGQFGWGSQRRLAIAGTAWAESQALTALMS